MNSRTGNVVDIKKSQQSEESLRAALLRHGISPNRIKDFIDSNLEQSKDVSEIKKGVSTSIDYVKEQLVFGEVELLRLLLEE